MDALKVVRDTPARALYSAHGFADGPPFGSYVNDPLSVFMTRTL